MNVLSNYGTRILCSLLWRETCKMKILHLAVLCVLLYTCECGPEEEEGVKYADKCEVCKVVAIELESRLRETGKSHEVLELGYSIDSNKNKKRMKYEKSELRLVESLDGVCERILEYNIHKERTDSTRFAKGMSQTFKTLHGLVDKGVKVELGIPLELWDKPSVEITNMKTQCEKLIEEYESDIEDWYFHHQGKSRLSTYLCTDRALKDANDKCLIEELTETKKKNKSGKQNNRKGDQESLKEEL